MNGVAAGDEMKNFKYGRLFDEISMLSESQECIDENVMIFF